MGNKISIVKLNDDNFLLWKLQISITLEGYELDAFFVNDPHLKYQKNVGSSTSIDRTISIEYKTWKC